MVVITCKVCGPPLHLYQQKHQHGGVCKQCDSTPAAPELSCMICVISCRRAAGCGVCLAFPSSKRSGCCRHPVLLMLAACIAGAAAGTLRHTMIELLQLQLPSAVALPAPCVRHEFCCIWLCLFFTRPFKSLVLSTDHHPSYN